MRRLLAAVALLVALPAGAARASVTLPGEAAAAAVRADARTWLVGARPGSPAAAGRLARAAGGRPAGYVAWEVPRERARQLASALRRRGLLSFAEPNRLAGRLQAADPLSAAPPWPGGWRAAVIDPGLVPPAVTPESPLLVLVDSQADLSHPDFAGGNITSAAATPVTNSHGTATAAVAAAPANGVGILGVWPGMRALNLPLPSDEITCADSARGIQAAVASGAAVINMSYGAPTRCEAEFIETQLATARGISLVAAAGNEFDRGNENQYPASLPHVITVAAIDPDGNHAFFSSASAAVDVSAPGEAVLTDVPAQFDADGVADGYEALPGTSFSAPIVAAAAAWLRAARPELAVDQVANVLRLSAIDLGAEGWDPSTGFGLLSVARALVQVAPAPDPLEPNDDMRWVDGRAFGRRAAPIFTGGRATRLFGLLDRYEDPSDVYRVVVPARRRVIVRIRPRFGDPDIALYDRRASSVNDRGALIDLSQRNGSRVDTLTGRNLTRRPRVAYVRVYIDRRATSLDAGYTLTARLP